MDDNLFKEIFDFPSVELANKIINITGKEDNLLLIDHIKIKRDKILEQDESHKRSDLLDTVKVTLEFNETIQPYLT